MNRIIIFMLLFVGCLIIPLILKRKKSRGEAETPSEDIKDLNLPSHDVSMYITRKSAEVDSSKKIREALHINFDSNVEYPRHKRPPRDIPGKELEEAALSEIDFMLRDKIADACNRNSRGMDDIFFVEMVNLKLVANLEDMDAETHNKKMEKIKECGKDYKKFFSYKIDEIIERYVEKGADEKYIRDNLPKF